MSVLVHAQNFIKAVLKQTIKYTNPANIVRNLLRAKVCGLSLCGNEMSKCGLHLCSLLLGLENEDIGKYWKCAEETVLKWEHVQIIKGPPIERGLIYLQDQS